MSSWPASAPSQHSPHRQIRHLDDPSPPQHAAAAVPRAWAIRRRRAASSLPAAHMASLGNGADGPHAQLGPPTLTLLARRGGPCSRPHRFAHLDSLPAMKLLAREVRRALVEVPAPTRPLSPTSTSRSCSSRQER